jgi:tRNA uridine 5-carboxymethylaminomethyl modification enzyme
MFTSRAEFRLTVRADNADQRLTPLGIAAGCVGAGRRLAFEAKVEQVESGRQRLREILLTPKELAAAGLSVSLDGGRRNAYEALSFPGAEVHPLRLAAGGLPEVEDDILQQLQIESTYHQYSDRQAREVAALQRQETQRIPEDIDYASISGLSNELKQKLSRLRPETMLHAARIEGVTPAALLLILSCIRRPAATRLAG